MNKVGHDTFIQLYLFTYFIYHRGSELGRICFAEEDGRKSRRIYTEAVHNGNALRKQLIAYLTYMY